MTKRTIATNPRVTEQPVSEPELVMIAVPRDRVDFTRWLAEAPAGILRAAVVSLSTDSLTTPYACADDDELAECNGKTADELLTEALRNPAEAAWVKAHWRDWLARMPRPKAKAD